MHDLICMYTYQFYTSCTTRSGIYKKTTTSLIEKMADSNSIKQENERLCIIM